MLQAIEKNKDLLHALKNGVVPKNNLEKLWVGGYKEFKELERCLTLASQGTGIVKFIEGNYGTGKSFMLHLCSI